MLRSTKLDGAGRDVKNGAAVLEYLKATEYYLNRDGNVLSSSHWMGGGSQALGLSGEVDIKVMEDLARGVAPDGSDLRQNAGDATRVGWDLTFSAVNSFSFVYSVADADGRDKLLETHHLAVEKALAFLEDEARVRTGKAGQGEQLQTTGLVASRHTHFGSRALEPQVHSHVLAYNAAQGVDGKWRALHADYMLQNVRSAGALYRAEQAWQLRQQGYGIIKDRQLDADGRETGEVFYKIAGIDERLTDRISTRRKEILEYHAQHGGTFDQASMATRKHKDEPTYRELVAMWHKSLEEAKEQDPTLRVPSMEELKSKACVLGEEITDDDILKRLHKTESSFTKAQLVERIALEHVGQKDIKGILKEVDDFLKRAQVVELTQHADHRLKKGEPKYAAQWMLDMEQEIGARGRARLDDVLVMVAPETVEAAIEQIEAKNGFKLNSQQVDVALHQTAETGGTAIVGGRAGTGKTTTSEVAVLAWQMNGQEVIGVSTGWDAAKKLEAEAKIKSFSAEKLLWDLENGKVELTNRHVVVFDEAGMAGTQVIHRLQRFTDHAGAKLVLQGDKHQLQPVSAGNPFDLLIKEVGHMELTEIRRQKNQPDRDTANLLYGEAGFDLGQELMERLDQLGQISQFDNRKQAIDQVADDWMASQTPAAEKLVIGGTRAEVKLLNEAIRECLKTAGNLGEREVTFKAKAGGQWHELKVAEGDRVRFTDRDKDRSMDVVNGYVGVVQGIAPGKSDDSHQITVRLESDIPSQNGRVVSFDTADYKSLTHAYAMTVHKSQGQGRQEVYHLASPSMTDRHLQLVAFTRTKEKYRMYGAKDDLLQMAPRMGRDRFKQNAIDQLAKPPAQEVSQPAFDEKTKAKIAGFRELLEEQRKRRQGKGLGMRR